MTETKILKFGLAAVYIPRTGSPCGRSAPVTTAPAPPKPYCGAPTKTGDECRNRVSAWGVVCAVHEPDYPW
ncbi:hypothetical protein ACQGAO_03955 [Rhodococcus sp. 1.20]|uniref:hypothetical protein n=1 Tax=Rhodococcus sp. 311R TaxID=1617904 RepID=UPI000A66C102|nr:hypothetical protein [Rhodococcus sp. 311R]